MRSLTRSRAPVMPIRCRHAFGDSVAIASPSDDLFAEQVQVLDEVATEQRDVHVPCSGGLPTRRPPPVGARPGPSPTPTRRPVLSGGVAPSCLTLWGSQPVAIRRVRR